MKQVVKSTPPNSTVTLDNVSGDKFYGVKLLELKEFGFIVQQTFRRGRFHILCPRGLTVHNTYDTAVSYLEISDLHQFINLILEKGHDVYEFDTFKELSDWLAKSFKEAGTPV